MRVLHFSDIHVEPPLVDLAAFLNKRALGYANLVLRRRQRFGNLEAKVRGLVDLAERERVDFVLCTGDYTALGTDAELAHARELVEPLTRRPLGFATVPGNHDLYVDDPGDFDRHFDAFLATDLPEHRAAGSRYPWVRLVGERLAVVGVNSARPNPQPWRSSGRIPDADLEALRGALADPRVAERFVIVATHYAPRLRDGSPDTPQHGLENADALLDACRGIRRGLVAFGHVHRRYVVELPDLSIPLLGAGSATDDRSRGAWIYELDDRGARALGAAWEDGAWHLEDAPAWHAPAPG